MAFRIELTPEAEDHLSDLTARDRATLVDQIEQQLLHEPTTETRNRKPMRPNPLAPWELRVGHLRVYYEVSADVVTVRAVGVKVRQRVRIGDEWWEPNAAEKPEQTDEDPGDGAGDG